ncbi:MAG: hypothetical protein LBQ54_05350 [Planctomycetaceae bacterium]|jgi:hypothetical protein|nr:hypothetical protein [Planctomycetaceae bacterium]
MFSASHENVVPLADSSEQHERGNVTLQPGSLRRANARALDPGRLTLTLFGSPLDRKSFQRKPKVTTVKQHASQRPTGAGYCFGAAAPSGMQRPHVAARRGPPEAMILFHTYTLRYPIHNLISLCLSTPEIFTCFTNQYSNGVKNFLFHSRTPF